MLLGRRAGGVGLGVELGDGVFADLLAGLMLLGGGRNGKLKLPVSKLGIVPVTYTLVCHRLGRRHAVVELALVGDGVGVYGHGDGVSFARLL